MKKWGPGGLWQKTVDRFASRDELWEFHRVTPDQSATRVQRLRREWIRQGEASDQDWESLHRISIAATNSDPWEGSGFESMDGSGLEDGAAGYAVALGGRRASKGGGKVGAVIEETANGAGNFTSGQRLNADEALDAGAEWVGEGYKDMGPSGSGLFRSADGTKQLRMTYADLDGAHGSIGSHVHLEKVNPNKTGKAAIASNNHIPLDE